jgi:hypothetical protein
MPFFLDSNLFTFQYFFKAHIFIISIQGFNFINIFQSFKTKLLPRAEKILFLVSKSQFINDCFALDKNSKAAKIISRKNMNPPALEYIHIL